MKPPEREKIDYEKVDTNDFVVGIVEEVCYDMEHKFTFQGKEKIKPAIRLKFKIDGYEFPHYSRWMSFSLGEKTNLYLKYVLPLVKDAKPDMNLDLDCLTDMKVKMLWAEKNDFQYIETIRPVGEKIDGGVSTVEATEEDLGEEAPLVDV